MIARFLLVGTIVGYDWILRMLGRGAVASLRGAQALNERRRARQDEDDDWAEPEMPAPALSRRANVLRAEPRFAGPVTEQEPAAAPRAGLLGKVGALLRGGSEADMRIEPELVERGLPRMGWTGEAPSADRIRERIADAVKARSEQGGVRPLPAAADRPEPTLSRGESFGLDTDLPDEPRLTARAALAQAETLIETDEDDNIFGDLDLDEPVDTAALPRAEHRRVVQHGAIRAPAPRRVRPSPRRSRACGLTNRRATPTNCRRLLLTNPVTIQRHQLDEALEENARMLESVLDDYGVKGEIVSVRPGPVVTMYELEPAPGLKASRVIGLADDIARSMSALSARVSTVPGRSVIGIELPNAHREKVVLREILAARDFGDGNHRLPLALGKDIAGDPVVANLAKMPHLLIAGTTGSGKSVAINTMILSLLYKLTPEECRLIMIDPKMLELSVYDGIPHLLSPVVTDPKKAVVALKWVVGEMEERYRKMSKMGVRNIDGYNGRVREALANGEMFKRTVQTGFDEETGDPVFETEESQPVALPYIVVIVDEMADLMMVAGKDIEAAVQRLAQMARAAGIHLITATQRPSVDVITGTIKANFPTRISFMVTSKIDSRTILGEQGAEQLLGQGDMLYMAGGGRIIRVHGPFVSDDEVEKVVRHLKRQGVPAYLDAITEDDGIDDSGGDAAPEYGDGSNDLYDQAVAVVLRDKKVSTSYIQRRLGIGYNRAATLIERMEKEGLIGSANHAGKREILVGNDDADAPY